MASRRGTRAFRAFGARERRAPEEPLRTINVLMTVPEVATLLRTSPKAIYTMIERQQLPVLRIGRRVLVDRDALVDWLRQKSTPSLEQVGQR